MYPLPDPNDSFEYENAFYLSCQPNRFAKMMAHADLFRELLNIPGEIVECGVFKGASLARFAMLRELFCGGATKKIIGFDAFGPFPPTEFIADQSHVEKWTTDAGFEGISREDLIKALELKGCGKRVELIRGNLLQTLPDYCDAHPELRISLLNLDTDVYEPAVCILNHLWDRIVPGGILLLDDFGVFPGETQAVEEFFTDRERFPNGCPTIQRLPYARTPSFVRKL